MQPGQQISANLRLARPLGQGGMGSVWVADHLGLGTQVAVKVMSRAVASEPQFVERFRREATAAAKLKSPHVAQVFDHGVTTTGEPYIVMELLEGEDAGKRVEKRGAQPIAFVAEVIAQTAKALSRAHAEGIVHRDIKAENVFLSEHDGEVHVKVLDFGIAKTTGDGSASVTATQGTFGTPLYMGPEQLLSAKHVDFRADLWSLGVLAYFLLTARYPFEGETLGAISVAVHEGRFVPASQRRAGLSAEVDAWFARAFQRDPRARFGSAKEMAEALRAAASTSHVTSLAVSAPIADPLGIGHMPTTMDTGSNARPPQGTLGGASISPGSEPKRRRVLLAVAGVTVGAIVTVIALQSQKPKESEAAQVQPSKDAAGAASISATVATNVSPAPAVSGLASADPASSGAIASAAPEPAPTATSAASATTAAGSARGKGKPPAIGGPAKTGKPASTKKDDVGF